MRFRQQSQGSQMPEVNLVPMMDVLMTVLTFFIIISMTLTGQQIVNVELPRSVTGAKSPDPKADLPQPLVIGLNPDGEILLESQPVSFGEMAQRLQEYAIANPKGTITLKADRSLTYAKVEQFLDQLRKIGGDRVFLAVE